MAAFFFRSQKHAEYITCADYHLAISSGIKQQMINRGVPESTINVILIQSKLKTQSFLA